MRQRWLVAVLLFVLLSGMISTHALAVEERPGYLSPAEVSEKEMQCDSPLASVLCPIDIVAQGRYLQEMLDACGGDEACFYDRLREEQSQYLEEASDTAWLDPASMGTGAVYLAETGLEVFGAAVGGVASSKPVQMHHFATNKNKTYSAEMERIANKHGLSLDGDWNQEPVPQQGRHTSRYHQWVLKEMVEIDKMARGDQEMFLRLFEVKVKAKVRLNPSMLYRAYWP